jgi:hypothetical protein
MDTGLGRTFRLPGRVGGAKLTLRADAYNALNHANLGDPIAFFDPTATSTFAVAPFGRKGRSSGFPASVPLDEARRQIQMSLHIEF